MSIPDGSKVASENGTGGDDDVTKPKVMDIEEFREKGYLLEVNRQFFHPLGLALYVEHDKETGAWWLGGIFDSRDDPEGWVMNEITLDDVRRALALKEDAAKRIPARVALLGEHAHPDSGVQLLVPHSVPEETPTS